MISLITNSPQFFNDISEEIRLFFGLVEISDSVQENTELSLRVTLENDSAVCILTPGSLISKVIVLPYTNSLDKKRQEKRALKLAVFNVLHEYSPVYTPWGSLTGIRPTKLYRDLAKANGTEEADNLFENVFSVSTDKLSLAKTIYEVQAPLIQSVKDEDFDVYLGIPYCKSRCLYCSFGTEVSRSETQLDEYLKALKEEIRQSSRIIHEQGFHLRCSYFGGGTPTVLDAGRLKELLEFTSASYGGFGSEFTVEAGRPDTITKEKLKVLKECGVTRISINPQSMNDKTLKLIGRFHSSDSVFSAYYDARDAGFTNINMDTIAGLPGENLDDFMYTLSCIKELKPESLTVHTLAIKKSSRLKDKLDLYPLPLPSVTGQMVSAGLDTANSMGMKPYYMYRQKYMSGNLENVGYCLPGKECAYNIDMMEETVSIMAHGAGTISKRVFMGENRVERCANPKDVKTYFDKMPVLITNKKTLFMN